MISQGYSTKCYDIWNSLYDNPVGQSKRGHRWTQNGHETMTIILRCWIWGRLGPGNFGCSAYTWTHLSSSNKIQRNWMRLSVTVCTGRGDKFWTKNTKRAKNSTATFEKSRAKAGYCSCPLHTIPSKGWVDHLSHPSGPTPGHTLTLTPYKEPVRPSLASKQRKHMCSHSPLLQQGPW